VSLAVAPGAPVITHQKFVAELQVLRTRATELGLPITANMIGIAIDVCESERCGDFLTVKRIEESPSWDTLYRRLAQHRERGQK